MKQLLVGAALVASLALGAGISEVRSVYLLPMAGGLDQHLANRLSGVFRVVTNPKLADAIFTEQLGAPFELKLAELFPPPQSAEDAKKDQDDKRAQPVSSFGRGKGTIFLVDLKSRAVIWSGYQKRNGSAPEALDRTASQIVKQIKKQQMEK